MSLSRDFDRVTIPDDRTKIIVEATTSEPGGKPVAPDPAIRMYITLIALPNGEVMRTAEPELPVVDSSWEVHFEDAAEAFAGVENVLCIGVALEPDEPPYVWTEQRPLTQK